MSVLFLSQPVLRHLLRIVSLLLVTAGLGPALLFGSPAFAAQVYVGRPVSEVLREWQGSGLTLIYNDQLVLPGMRVEQEPAATMGIALLTEILAPHGLTLQAVGPGAWSVVAAAGRGDPVPDKAARPARLDTIVVTASRYALARDDVGVSTLLVQDELRALPKLADDSLRAVHRLPGAASNGLSGLAHIRGGEENETQIVLDGLPLAEPFHLKNFFSPVSVLDPEIVGAMDVYAGGFPVNHGDRMSAVIDVRSVIPPVDGVRAIGASLYHTSGVAGGSFDAARGRWLLSGRRSNLADVINLANSNLGEPKYFDSFSKVEYDVSEDTTGALHLLVVDDHLQVNNSQETEYSRVGDRSAYIWVTAGHRWSEQLSGQSLLSYTNVDNDRDGTVDDPGESSGYVHDHRSFTATSLKLELQQGDDELLFRYGLDLGLLNAHYSYSSRLDVSAGNSFPDSPPSLTIRQSALQPSGSQMGAFVSGRWRMTGRLTAELGMRWDNQTWDRVDGGTQLSPRLNLRYDPGERTQLRASWGRFFQAQGIDELQLEDGIETFFPAQRADHLIFSAEHELANRMRVRLEAYYKDYEELKPRYENQFDSLVVIPELQTDRIEVAATSASVRGLELLLNRRGAGPWGWWLSYTWSQADDDIDGADVPRSWDQTHSFNAGLNWISGAWDVTLAGTWHTGWPTTPVMLGEVPPGEVPPVLTGERNATRFDAFKSVDLRVAYTFALEKSELLTFVEFTNLLVQKNPCCVEYSVRDTGNGVYTLVRDVDDWIRFAPNFGVLWRF